MQGRAQIQSKQTRQAASILHLLNQVEAAEDAIIAQLDQLPDDVLIEVRMQCKVAGRALWHIECAADAVILKRESQRRGQGVQDIEGRGVEAAVRQHAAHLGVDPRTIYENAAIHQNFFNSGGATRNKVQNGTLEHLQEKEFYRLALRSDDPHAALEKMAKQKAVNPHFSTRDARRMVYEEKTPPLDQGVPPLIEDPEIKTWYQRFAESCNSAPTPGLRRILRDVLDEVRNYVQRPSKDRHAQLLALIKEHVDELDLIAKEIAVDRIHVAVWLNRLVEDGTLVSFEKERAPGARGAARTGYKIVKP